MRITNTERMTQLASAINSLTILVEGCVEKQLDTKVSPYCDLTLGQAIDRIKKLTHVISGTDDESAYYYADIDLPYNEDTFPVLRR